MRFLLILLLAPALAWAEPATTVRQVELKKGPAADAETIGQLAEGTAVEAFERRGSYTRVKTASGEGWVRMLALRFGGPGQAKRGSSGIGSLFNVARTGSSGTTVTTGVRGLDPEMLANAQPNLAELEKMKRFAATPQAAAGFAAKGQLRAQQVPEVQ
jgi:hypothetical protein